MGAINYFTSDYITLGVRPYDRFDMENDIDFMEEVQRQIDEYGGSEHKASYKAVTSSRIDTTALKRDMPEIAAKYTKTTNTRRFLFV